MKKVMLTIVAAMFMTAMFAQTATMQTMPVAKDTSKQKAAPAKSASVPVKETKKDAPKKETKGTKTPAPKATEVKK